MKTLKRSMAKPFEVCRAGRPG